MTNHVSNTCSGSPRTVINITNTASEESTDLPRHFAVVPPASLRTSHPKVPITEGHVRPTEKRCHDTMRQEDQWLSKVKDSLSKSKLEEGDFLHWLAYHAQGQSKEVPPCATIGLLPLFDENAPSVAMVKHVLVVARYAIHHLNLSQTSVIAMDQLLYSLAKQIQWTCPETLGEQNYIVVLGGLHIKMVCLHILGQWLEGSGWWTALVEAGVTTSGKAASLISGSHVKHTRYAHHVTEAALHVLQQSAYKAHIKDAAKALDFQEWVKTSAQQYP